MISLQMVRQSRAEPGLRMVWVPASAISPLSTARERALKLRHRIVKAASCAARPAQDDGTDGMTAGVISLTLRSQASVSTAAAPVERTRPPNSNRQVPRLMPARAECSSASFVSQSPVRPSRSPQHSGGRSSNEPLKLLCGKTAIRDAILGNLHPKPIQMLDQVGEFGIHAQPTTT
jgi:hypothetical protein